MLPPPLWKVGMTPRERGGGDPSDSMGVELPDGANSGSFLALQFSAKLTAWPGHGRRGNIPYDLVSDDLGFESDDFDLLQ